MTGAKLNEWGRASVFKGGRAELSGRLGKVYNCGVHVQLLRCEMRFGLPGRKRPMRTRNAQCKTEICSWI